jgi:hypothetical protein
MRTGGGQRELHTPQLIAPARRRRPPLVGGGALAWGAWSAEVFPTLRDHAYVLGKPGVLYTNTSGASAGYVMAALGDRPAAKITTRDINELLAAISNAPRTKSGRVRRVLADQAAAALERMSRCKHFTDPDDLVFCNVLGRSLDDSALRRRYRRAQVAAGVRPLRFHDLRHTFGSLLAIRVDVVTIQKAMGHSALATTSR